MISFNYYKILLDFLFLSTTGKLTPEYFINLYYSLINKTMKGLAALARRASQARNALVVRGGGGGPMARPDPPSQPLAEQDEL